MGGKITVNCNLITSKNGKKIAYIYKNGKRKPIITDSDKAKKHEKELLQLLSLPNMKKAWGKIESYPVHVHFKIYRKTDGIFDYINIIQKLCDCMTKCEYWPDDDAKHIIPVFHQYEKDKDNPRCDVWW